RLRKRFEEEGVERCVADRELRRVHVPTLVVALDERPSDVARAAAPRGTDRIAIADRDDVRRAVGDRDAASGERLEHDLLGEVAGWMRHRLMRGGDPAARG